MISKSVMSAISRSVLVALLSFPMAALAEGAPATTASAEPPEPATVAPPTAASPAAHPPAAGEPEGRDRRQNSAAEVAREGTFLPMTVAARVGDQYFSAMALGGYDSLSDQQGRVVGVVEGSIANHFALRVAADYASSDASNAVLAVGFRIGILRQEQHHFDLGFMAQYKTKGFSESKGEVELLLLASRRWGRFGLFGNAVYGQGIIANERDGEVRLAAMFAVHPRVNVGIDTRARFDLGAGPLPNTNTADHPFDLVAGPMVTAAWGPVALLAQAGVHVAVTDLADGNEVVNAGAVVLAGAGATY
jgi:hypothetical protein